MKQIKGKTALITGASSGIGKELATIHAEHGGNCILVARSREALEKLKIDLHEKHGSTIHCIVKDLRDPSAAKEIYDQVNQIGMSVDFLINNAGFGGIGKFHERKWEKDFSMINVNIVALTALTRFFLPDFVKRNSGHILNVSSTASLVPGPLQAVYYASKAYVSSFSNAIAEELHDTAVTVTTLMPGPTETGFGKISGMDKTVLFRKVFSARRVAEDGYKGMLEGKLNVMTAVTIGQRIMFRMVLFIPRGIVLTMVRRMQET